jgi:predicted MFS family arabinose efflux permease
MAPGVLMTAAQAISMLPLFLLGTLAPYLVSRFGITTGELGLLVSVGFAVAAALSPAVGPAVTAMGPRRSLGIMFLISTLVLASMSLAPSYAALIGAVGLSGLAQSLANPATNQLIATRVPVDRQGPITGLKQSGVQVGAFCAGLPLASLAASHGWRLAVGVTAVIAAACAVGVALLPADEDPWRPPRLTLPSPGPDGLWLAGFSVPLGAGLSAVSTYATLFATRELRWHPPTAAALVAVLGVAGIVGRIVWSRIAGSCRPGRLLGPLMAGAVLAATALAIAPSAGGGWAVVGIIGVGVFAASANAVSMVTIIARTPRERVGSVSAVVAAGFFGGYALGPLLGGMFADTAGTHLNWSWWVVAGEFVIGAAVAQWWHRRAARA